MTMGIVNAGQLGVYSDIPKDLLERVEDVLLNRKPREVATRALPSGWWNLPKASRDKRKRHGRSRLA